MLGFGLGIWDLGGICGTRFCYVLSEDTMNEREKEKKRKVYQKTIMYFFFWVRKLFVMMEKKSGRGRAEAWTSLLSDQR
jgi:hypothetical protein